LLKLQGHTRGVLLERPPTAFFMGFGENCIEV